MCETSELPSVIVILIIVVFLITVSVHLLFPVSLLHSGCAKTCSHSHEVKQLLLTEVTSYLPGFWCYLCSLFHISFATLFCIRTLTVIVVSYQIVPDDTRWQTVTRTNSGLLEDFVVSYQNLLPSTSYTFRVIAYNVYGISYPAYSDDAVSIFIVFIFSIINPLLCACNDLCVAAYTHKLYKIISYP